MLRGEENLVCLAEGKHGKKRFLHHQRRKHEYFSLLEMAMAEGCLHFLDELVANDGDACLLELKSQIMAFKRGLALERSAFTDRKITFSGKVDGTGKHGVAPSVRRPDPQLADVHVREPAGLPQELGELPVRQVRHALNNHF